jgi:4-carboxymuconolactone decarboxylase
MASVSRPAWRWVDEDRFMTRLSYVDPTALNPEQQELYDSIVSGPRLAKRPSLVDAQGHLTGPFNAFLHCPALGRHWSQIGEGLRFRTGIDRRLFELAILVVAVHWRSGHEWAAHAKLAREAGIDDSAIAGLRQGERPKFTRPDEIAVFAFVDELVRDRRASDRSYAGVVSVLGEGQTVELVNAVAYYIALAAMLNAFAVHPPAGLDDPWPQG